MKASLVTAVSIPVLLISHAGYAACSPPDGEPTADCISCGNLEQNVARAHDLAWNEFLDNTAMQLQLRSIGATRVHLVNPPHASPGVLFYTVVIEDPQFRITDSASQAVADEIRRQWEIAFRYDGATVQAEWAWREQQLARLEEALSTAVATGSGPYLMRLFDSRGNAVSEGTVEWPRHTPPQQRADVGPSDLFPDARHANEACVSADPRFQTDDDNTGGIGDGERDDAPPDYGWLDWEESHGFPTRYHCVPDFSDPAGSGVICFG